MKHPTTRRRIISVITVLLFLALFVGVVLFGQALGENPEVQSAIAEAGYLGVVIAAIVAGLNIIFPIPAATLAPLFIAAGLSTPFIILALTAGTLIADTFGYAIGHFSRNTIAKRYPKTHAFFHHHAKEKPWLVYPFVFFYAAFVPFPNEAIMIPIAIAGMRLGPLLIPLVIGNLINQAILVYGISELTRLFF